MTDERLAFSLKLLADAEHSPRPLAACSQGHLVVGGNTHWRPAALDRQLRTLACDLVEHCDG